MFEKIISLINRIFFIFSFLLFFVAIWNKILGFFGLRISWINYTSSQLIEFSAVLIMFVIALVVRQIREEIKKKNL